MKSDAELAKQACDEAQSDTLKAFQKSGFTAKRIAAELAILAFSDPANHAKIDEGGALTFIPFKDQGKHRRAIKSIEEKTVITESKDGTQLYKTSTVKYALWSKENALDMAMSVIGMKKPVEVKHSGSIRLEDLVAGVSDDKG